MSSLLHGNTRTNSPDGDLTRYNPTLLPALSRNDAAPEPPEPTAPRERLKQAVSALEAAKAELENAQALSAKAARLHENAKTDFGRSQQASHAVLQWKISTFKSGSTSSLPPDLRDAREEGVFASENLQHAETLASTMAQELQIAQSNLASAESAKLGAANAVVADEAQQVINEIERLGNRRKYLRDVLRGASLVGVSPKQHGEFEILKAGAMHDPAVAQFAYPPSAPGSTKYWADFRTALLSDIDAKLGEPPAADELWS